MLAVLAIATSLAASSVAAALYKWVDANGRTVYSDQPPTNVKAELMGASAPAANPEAAKELATKDAEFKKRQSDRLDEAKKSEKARADAQKLAASCVQARSQASGLRRTELPVYRLNDKGERVLMDDAARKAEADRLDAMVKERNCPPA